MHDVLSLVRSACLSTFLLCTLAACSPGPDQPPAPGGPPPPPDQPLPPAPQPPEGTDFEKPGKFGDVGVDPTDENKPDADVPVGEHETAGGIQGSSNAEQSHWDTLHPYS